MTGPDTTLYILNPLLMVLVPPLVHIYEVTLLKRANSISPVYYCFHVDIMNK